MRLRFLLPAQSRLFRSTSVARSLDRSGETAWPAWRNVPRLQCCALLPTGTGNNYILMIYPNQWRYTARCHQLQRMRRHLRERHQDESGCGRQHRPCSHSQMRCGRRRLHQLTRSPPHLHRRTLLACKKRRDGSERWPQWRGVVARRVRWSLSRPGWPAGLAPPRHKHSPNQTGRWTCNARQ